MVSHAVELHQGAACRVVVPDGGLDLPAQEEEFTLGEVLIDHLESGPVHAPEQFHPAVSAVRSLGYAHIEPTGDPQFRKHPMPQVVESVDHFPRKTGNTSWPSRSGRTLRFTACRCTWPIPPWTLSGPGRSIPGIP